MDRHAKARHKGAEKDLAHIRRTGDRVRAALRLLIDELPPEARGISGMARFLGVHKATCQRVVEGLGPGIDGAVALTRLPGSDGLRKLIGAAQRRGAGQRAVTAARNAVGEIDALLRTHGGTRQGLTRLVASLARTTAPAPVERTGLTETHRRALFDSAWRVTGEQVGVKSVAALLRVDPQRRTRLRMSAIVTLAGVRREPFSRPIAPFLVQGPPDRPPLPSEERASYELLERFSTTGLQAVTLDASQNRTVLVIDLQSPAPESRENGDPKTRHALGPADVSVFWATRAKTNPLTDRASRIDMASRTSQPCRLLLMDVLVHRDIAGLCVPEAGCFTLSTPAGNTPEGAPEACWHERLPEAPEVRRLTAKQMQRPHEQFPLQAELVGDLLKREHTSVRDVAGFRLEVSYPVWQTEYRLYLIRPETRKPAGGRRR